MTMLACCFDVLLTKREYSKTIIEQKLTNSYNRGNSNPFPMRKGLDSVR